MKFLLYILLVSFLALRVLNAQEVDDLSEEDAPPTSTFPSFNKTEEAANSSADSEGTVPPFILVDETAQQIVDRIEVLTGKTALFSQNLPQTQISFNSRTPLTVEQTVRAFESLLSMNGISVVQLDEQFFKVVVATETRTQSPELITGRARDLAPSQKIYAKLFPLNFLSTQEVQPILTSFVSATASLVPFEKSSSIMLTDTLTNIQRVESLLEKIDRPSEVVEELLFFNLQYTNASDLQQRFQSLQNNSLKKYLEGNTSFEADERTNQLIVLTHSSNQKLISDLVAKFDVDVAPLTRSEVFYIKHAESTVVAGLLQQVITNQQQNQEDSNSASNSNNNTQTTNPDVPVTPPTATASAVTSEVSGSENLQFSDQVSVVPDERSNALIVSGTNSDITYIEKLINKIDIVLAQVRIDVMIVEVTLTDDQVRGIDNFGVSIDDANEIGLSVGAPSTSRLSQPAFSYSGNLRNFTMDLVINTAKRNSNVEVRSTPSLQTTHNQEATIQVGESRPVITGTNTDSTSTNTRSTIQFRDIGIELTVKPLIGADGTVQMEITQKVENVVDTVRIEDNDQPIIGIREAQSFVTVADGEMIVLGGLQEQNFAKAKGRMTLFGRIPVLGNLLFTNRTEEKTNRELMIFIRPTVLQTTADAQKNALDTISPNLDAPSLQNFIKSGSMLERTEVVPQNQIIREELSDDLAEE